MTNSGTAPTVINKITVNYAVMTTEVGAPTGDCTVAPGATAYMTLTGVGMDMATTGEAFSFVLTGSNGASAYVLGAFS